MTDNGAAMLSEEVTTGLPTLGHTHGTIYVLPEDGPVQAMFVDPDPQGANVAARKISVSSSGR